MKKLLLIILFVANNTALFAQNFSDVKIKSGRDYVVIETSGTQITGTVLNQDENDIMINSKQAGIVVIHKIEIKEVRKVSKEELSQAKSVSGTFFYGEIGGGYGTHGSLKIAFDIINHTSNTISICFFFSSHRDPDRPPDFAPGLFEPYPQQQLYMFGIMYGKVFYSKQTTTRFVLKGGLSGGVVYTPQNYISAGSWFEANYTYSLKHEFTPGILLNPTMELPVRRYFGLSFGLYTNVNFISPVFGVEGSMIFGKLRNKTLQEMNRKARRHRPFREDQVL
jgi:hypothetical protein